MARRIRLLLVLPVLVGFLVGCGGPTTPTAKTAAPAATPPTKTAAPEPMKP
jgi:hypothetical protein